jgi:hypothetical protein
VERDFDRSQTWFDNSNRKNQSSGRSSGRIVSIKMAVGYKYKSKKEAGGRNSGGGGSGTGSSGTWNHPYDGLNG